LSVLVAVVIAGGLAVSEAWSNPLLVAWALIVEMTGYFAFFMIGNAVAGFVARPPRARPRRVAEASAVAGGAAVQVAVAFRAELGTVIGAGPAKSVPAVVALTLGAGLATSLATAGVLALRRFPVPR
jgi:peptidoglycan/LPS O-acetylase OafA/YrhL